jgi:hypothetical protein
MTNKTQKLQLSKIIVDVGCGYDKKAQAIGIDNRKTKSH